MENVTEEKFATIDLTALKKYYAMMNVKYQFLARSP
jgi:hypothetical protein